MKNLSLFTLLMINFLSFSQTPSFDWAFGIPSALQINKVINDANNNIYGVGSFSGTIDIDPSNTTQNITSLGQQDIIIEKISSTGNLIWHKEIGGLDFDNAIDVHLDNNGNIIIAGIYSLTVDFNPSITNTNNLTSSAGGYYDIFILKLDSNGNFLNAKSFGGIGPDEVKSLEIDNNNNIYFTGQYKTGADFDPDNGITQLTCSYMSSFVCKLNSNLTLSWAKSFNNNTSTFNPGYYDKGTSVVVDNNFDVHVVGEFDGTVDINPGIGSTNFTSTNLSPSTSNTNNTFYVKLNSLGEYINAYKIDVVAPKMYKNSSNIYLTGSYISSNVDFNLGTAINNLPQGSSSGNGQGDSFILKLDNNFGFIWVKKIGSESSGGILTFDNLNNIYYTGDFTGTKNFNPQGIAFNLTSGSSIYYYNAFISKFNNAGSFIWAIKYGTTANSSTSVKSSSIDNQNSMITVGLTSGNADFDPNSGTYNLNGNFNFYQKLSQCTNSTSTINPTTCSSYTAPDGQVYTQSGNYTATIQNSLGCDSVITINLTVSNGSISSITETACKEYQAPDGQIYTQSGTYVSIIPNSNGCDSTITINLTINTLVTSIAQNGASLNCTTNNAQYQWINCSTNQPINGATSQNYNPTSNGAYSVIATTSGCSDTSNCFELTNLSINELNTNYFNISPNPTAGDFTIAGLELYNNISRIYIFDVNGKLVKELDPTASKFTLGTVQPGVYFLTISAGNKQDVIKLIKD
jgi:hypothetical protein